jgi:8-oxo-dGTP pyrophosphatase MutT (NUDIX family)
MRLAATVLLLRDSDNGIEVFMEKRHIKSDFVGGAYVFPGGAVDPSDADSAEELCSGLDDDAASKRLGVDDNGLAFYVAAIRECFEEAGVLLAYDSTGELLSFEDEAVEDHYKKLRDQLNSGDITIQQIARQEGLTLATDLIEYWSHWITPAGQPRRYDTYFFAVRAPSSQTAAHDDWELTSSAWVTPMEALDRGAAREWMIIFPTVKNLIELGSHATAEKALAAARAKPELPANQPKVRVVDGVGRVVLPGDEGYEAAPEVPPGEGVGDQRIWFAWAEEYQKLRASGWGRH